MTGPLGMIEDILSGAASSDQTISNAVGCSGSVSRCSACLRKRVSSIVKALPRNGRRTRAASTSAGAAHLEAAFVIRLS